MSIFTPPHLYNSSRWRGLRVGILGGSFNPPHEGHVHITKAALSGLDLDVVWWLVTPQNPLKLGKAAPLPLDERMALCREIMDHPKVLISDLEKDFGTTITFQTIKKIKTQFPKTDFVWISGMDNALTLHQWNNWQELLDIIPMVHLTRMPATSLIQNCPLRGYENQRHVVLESARRVPLDSGVTYWLLTKKMVNISSTQIREKQSKNNGL